SLKVRNVPPYTLVPPCSAMPFMIAPMPCSRMPKCRVRPYLLPGNIFDSRSCGRKDGSPFIVVSLLPARSAEPPRSWGSGVASALSPPPDALRVATPLGSALNSGSALAQPSGRARLAIRSNSAFWSACFPAQASKDLAHSACAARPRSSTWRAWSTRSWSSGKFTSGSNPRTFLVAATSASPRAEPCAAPVPCLFGAGREGGARLCGGGPADDRPQGDETRLGRLGLGRLERVVQGLDVLVVAVGRVPVQPLDVPPVGLVAGRGVLVLGDDRVVLDRDVVVVVQDNEVAQ